MDITSEYIGIRIAMVDALQRVGDVSVGFPDEVVPKLQRAIREACRDNRMLGPRREAIGEAWAQFLGTRDPYAVLAFVNHPDVVKAVEGMPELVNDAHRITPIRALKLYWFSSKFEHIAQESGLIDYKGGETLQAHLNAQLASLGPVAPAPKESPRLVRGIHDTFNSDFGTVPAEHLHMSDAEAKTALKVFPPSSPERER